jgi:hypothetical protein
MGDRLKAIKQTTFSGAKLAIDTIRDRVAFVQSLAVEELSEEIGRDEIRTQVLGVLRRLADDPINMPLLLRWLRDANRDTTRFWEIRCALLWYAKRFQPRSYLEVGVRRGWSIAQVAFASPDSDLYGIDMWIKNYAGVPNPGPSLVRAEIRELGHRGRLALASGDSHKLLPRLAKRGYPTWLQERVGKAGLRRRWPAEYDVITVDGDHTVAGARSDLQDVFPICAVGGMVVFDDLSYEGDERSLGGQVSDESLGTVWKEFERSHPNFRFFNNVTDGCGTGLAFRLK